MMTLLNDQEIVQQDNVLALEDDTPVVENHIPALNTKTEGTFKSLNVFSNQVLGKLSKDDVPPTPENYKIYFDAHLESKSESQRKEIGEILELEAEIEANHTVTLEKDIQNAFIYIKSMTESISTAYTKISQMKKITLIKEKELELNPSRLTLVSYEEDLEAMKTVLEKELKQIKSRYNATAELIRSFNQKTIYDKKYGVYNKKYMLKTIDSVLKSVESFNHDNTLISIKIKESSLDNVQHPKDKSLINMTLAKLLLKRSRRSDIVGHYDEGIFVIVLKHTSLDHANIAIGRINDMIETANFIVDSNNIDIKLNFGISAIEKSKSKEEILIEAIDKL